MLQQKDVSGYGDMQQLAAFKTRKNAEKLVQELKKEGEKAYIVEAMTKDKKKIYKVFIQQPEESKIKDTSGNLPQEPAQEVENVSGEIEGVDSTQKIASFRIFTEQTAAESYAGELTNAGFKTDVKREITEDSSVIYTVFSERPVETSFGTVIPGDAKEQVPAETLAAASKPAIPGKSAELPEEPAKVAVMAAAIPAATSSAGGKPVVSEKTFAAKPEQPKNVLQTVEVAKEPVAETSSADKAAVSTGTISSKDVYGTEGGYIHPYLAFRTYYSDNVYNDQDNKKGDYAFVISPGIWLTVPRINQKLLQVDSANISPGGLNTSMLNPASFRRYQAYLHYGADIVQHASESSANTVDHKLEGLLRYNLKGGVSFQVFDRYLFSHDSIGTGTTNDLDKFTSNMAGLMVLYDTRNKFLFRFDYTNFLLNYSGSDNSFRDRDDNTFSGYVFYKTSPKTSLFVQYEYIDINYESDRLLNYDSDTSLNSSEHHYWGGIDWNITAKSTGRIKAGYAFKNFASSTIGDSRDFIYEIQVDHKFTPKTSLILKSFRKTQETDLDEANYIITTGVGCDYLQRITGKLLFNARLGYWNEIYRGDLAYDGGKKQRNDDIFEAGFGFQYNLKEWLKFDLGYLYSRRDSNFPDEDYTTNTIFFGLSGELSLALTP